MTFDEFGKQPGTPTAPTAPQVSSFDSFGTQPAPTTPDQGVIANLNSKLAGGTDTMHPALTAAFKSTGWWGSRVAQDIGHGLSESYGAAKTAVQRNMSNGPGLDPLSTGLQVTAPLVKAAASPLTEGFSSALHGLWHLTDIVSQGDLTSLTKQLGDTETAKQTVGAIQNVAKVWNDFATKHPTVAADLKSTYDIGTNLPIVAAEANLATGAIEATKKGLADRAASANADKMAQMVQSVDEAAGKSGGIKDPTLFGKATVPVTDANRATAQEFADQLGPNIGKPAAAADALNSHIADVSENTVRPFLESHNSIFNKQTLKSTLDSVIEDQPINFTANDGAQTYEKVIDTAMKIVDENPKNMTGLWDARKAFDQAVADQFPNAFDGTSTATKQAIRNVREAMNQFIIDGTGGAVESAGTAGVAGAANTFEEAMAHMSKAFDLRDNLQEWARIAVKGGKTGFQAILKAHPNLVAGARIGAEIAGAGYVGSKILKH